MPVKDKPGLQFNGHEAGDGEIILKHAGRLGFEGVVSTPSSVKAMTLSSAPPQRSFRRRRSRGFTDDYCMRYSKVAPIAF